MTTQISTDLELVVRLLDGGMLLMPVLLHQHRRSDLRRVREECTVGGASVEPARRRNETQENGQV